jgi:hypothetical protein
MNKLVDDIVRLVPATESQEPDKKPKLTSDQKEAAKMLTDEVNFVLNAKNGKEILEALDIMLYGATVQWSSIISKCSPDWNYYISYNVTRPADLLLKLLSSNTGM